jgi:transposase-like protein
MRGEVRRYSEAFKRQVVGDLARGRFGSVHEAAGAYGIGRGRTVRRWVLQMGKESLLKRVVRMDAEGEPGELARSKARERELERALTDAVLDRSLAEARLELLCEQQGVDAEAFKKKHAAIRWRGPGNRPKGSLESASRDCAGGAG